MTAGESSDEAIQPLVGEDPDTGDMAILHNGGFASRISGIWHPGYLLAIDFMDTTAVRTGCDELLREAAAALEQDRARCAALPPREETKPTGYLVKVVDNFHRWDSDWLAKKYGPFPSYAAAVECSKTCIDRELDRLYEQALLADPERLFRTFTSMGDEPYIAGSSSEAEGSTGCEEFSPRDYARQRCDQICAEPRNPLGG